MGDDRFDQNFMWYEWSFISPEEMPCDETPSADVEGHTMAASSTFTWTGCPPAGEGSVWNEKA